LRLRRALVAAAATSSALLHPAASASIFRPLPPAASFVPLLLPAAAGGFVGSTAAARGRGYSGVADDSKIDSDAECVDNGCDYNHWLITMDFPDPKPSREEMIETYLKTLAQVVGSYEEARKRMYAFSTTTYTGFQVEMRLPGVVFVLPDAYLAYTKEYGGDKYDNGVITPARLPYPYWGKSSRPDWNYQNNPPLTELNLDPSLGREKMARRFVNIGVENVKSGLYSLHRLDVMEHLFYYTSATEAEEASAKAESKNKCDSWAPHIPTLQRLPAPSMSFQPTPTTMWDHTTMEFFALLSPRSSENRILCCCSSGDFVVYNPDSQCLQCMPGLHGGFIGRRPIIISTGWPGAREEDLFVLHPGAQLSRFHVLRFGSHDRMDHHSRSRKGWLWESLPPLPFGGIINSHTVIDGGRTICVSSTPDGLGTYCFDTVEREWWEAGDWVLPFEGRAEYIPELNLWLGFSLNKPHHLCATSDLFSMNQPPLSQGDMPYLSVPDEWSTLSLDLINLGEGKFCIVEIFEIVRDTEDSESDGYPHYPDWDTIESDFAVLTGVELVTSGGDGDRRLEKLRIHKSKRYIFNQDKIEWVI
ncbi:hypothetical protein EJB05_08884, partial [Eragrostis curvula]